MAARAEFHRFFEALVLREGEFEGVIKLRMAGEELNVRMVLRWARIQAARMDTSVSRFIGDMLGRRREAEESYGRARRRFMGRKPVHLKESGSYPSREELHDRPHVR